MLQKILLGSLYSIMLSVTGVAQAATWQVLGGSLYVPPDSAASSPAFSAPVLPLGNPGTLVEGSYQAPGEIFASFDLGTNDPSFAWNYQISFYTSEFSSITGSQTPPPSINLASGVADLSSFNIRWYEVNFESLGATNVPITQNLDGSYHLSWELTGGFSSTGTATMTMDIAAVPVPAAVWLFGSGLLGLAGLGRRFRKQG